MSATAFDGASMSIESAPPRARRPPVARPRAKVVAFPQAARDAGLPRRPVGRRTDRFVADEAALAGDIQNAFSHYVPPRLVERLMADPRLLNLGGETREITVLFADVRGFTALAEHLEDNPQALVRVLNAVLCPLSEIVLSYGGTIDKYMGDNVMAFWGAPQDDPDHADHAIEAACAMLGAINEIDEGVRRAAAGRVNVPPMRLSIGVNSGACVVGNLGCQHRFDYSAIGDPVNVASRLEGLSKDYDVPLLIGEGTARRLRRASVIQVDSITVRGRTGAQDVFTLAPPPLGA